MPQLELPRLPHRMTLGQFRELPEGPPHFELIDGELIMAPAPNLYHQEITFNIAYILRAFLRGGTTGKAFIAPLDVFLGEDCFEPDVVFVSAEKLGLIAQADGLHGAPDLVVEVLSESTYRRDLTRKRRKYAAAGVREYWIADPEEKSLRQYLFTGSDSTSEEPTSHHRDNAVFESPLFPGLRIELAEIFRR
jgi:Uma2 family endonuclease